MNKREVKVAAVQFACTRNVDENIATADKYVREAAKAGANIILIPELFERQYFCQERRYDYYDFATSIEDNKAVNHFIEVAKELSVVVIVSVYEKDITRLFNSVVVIDADGTNLGTYRKTHIPDDHYYQEKFYFTPGDTGFMAFETKFAKIGVGICWDQWF
ncbi:MAG: N-carbamoylputrescine amidase, partial [Lachnospira sp.]|nr:N-carbamoylputrescine amidase [Lachnospira sp.]